MTTTPLPSYGIWTTDMEGKRVMGFTPDQWFDREKEHNAAIERKDALLRRMVDAWDEPNNGLADCYEVVEAIKQELSQ